MLSALALTIISSANIVLAVSVLLNNSRAALNRAYAVLALTLSAWLTVVYFEDTAFGHGHIQNLAKLDYFLATIMIASFLWFCSEFSNLRLKAVKASVLVAATVNIALVWTGNMIAVRFSGTDIIFEPKAGFLIFLVYLVLTVAGSLLLLWRRYAKSRGRQHAQLRFVGLGILLTISFVVITNIFVPRVFNLASPDITRIGLYSIIFFTGFCWYSIVRQRFLDIRSVVARSVAYLFLLGTLALGFSIVAAAVSAIFFPNASESLAQNVTTTIIGVTIAFIFQPLRRFFERITDNIFYRDRYDSQKVLNEFSKILVSEYLLDKLLKRCLEQLTSSLSIQFAQIVVFKDERVYRVEHVGPLPKRLMVVPELRHLNKPMLIADELPAGERKNLLEDHGLRISLTLHTRSNLVGYLLLGDKLSGDIYSAQDIALLEIIGKELAVAISNAKAYAEIQEFNVTLQARVDHATARLRVANRHLKELDVAKDEFISMASHQLRTPLTTIKGYLSMMLEGDAGKLSKQQTEFTDYAFTSSERMVNLISDLLNVSRLSAGRFIILPKPTDMVAMTKDEIRQLQQHADAKGIKLTLSYPEEGMPLAEIDDNKTRQVVMNFIDNAIYYTAQGEVHVQLEHPDGHVRLTVHDTGIGVPEKAKKHLFTKFFRADNAQSVRPDGTGLGLYLAKRVVEDQGGTIIFSSTEGKGSIFGFELPMKPLKNAHEDHHDHHAKT